MYDLPYRVEMEFRDGKFLVPDHLAPVMKQIETHRLTYQEAVAAANRLMERNFISAQGDQFRAAHFGQRR